MIDTTIRAIYMIRLRDGVPYCGLLATLARHLSRRLVNHIIATYRKLEYHHNIIRQSYNHIIL